MKTKSLIDVYLKIAILSTIVILAVYYAGNIIMPILLSGVISLILFPLVRKLNIWGIPKSLAVGLVVLLASASMLIVIFGIGFQTQKIISEFPEDEVEEVFDDPIQSVEDKTDVKISKYTKEIENVIEQVKSVLVEAIPSALNRLTNTIVFFITCPIYIFFMLLYSENIRDFYLQSIKNRSRGKAFIKSLEATYQNYVKGMLMVILIVSVLTGLGLFLLGIKYAIFIGILTGILTLIPYVGVFISASIPIVLALITKESIWYAVGVLLVYVVVQFLEGNFITPKIVGNQVSLNPLVVIIGLVIFGAVGGVAGMIITIPVLALIKTMANHNPSWRPLKTLIETR
ncbi:AI-2E family transporter [Crocinitomix catalasitica]|uniref:AI-2E family transporter n=1 Tax=Crocinitomix catalasitica TaxID=184607 RepID=UPI0004849393|nr:AI-2E family transporter [Crocinitomix catalasitica]